MGRDFVYLASASPRRAQLLTQIGVEFVVRPANAAERRLGGEAPFAYAERIARVKALEVWARVADEPRPIVAADTIVVVDGEVFGKPNDRADALRMLERMSGRAHSVATAVCVHFDNSTETALQVSEVRFRATTATERDAYCDSGEPYDKAGAYGIQGCGAVFVETLTGSYSGVMGLPVFETARLLSRFHIPCWLQVRGDSM